MVDDRLPTRAVLVTMHSDRAVFERAMAIGVRGYVLKDAALSEVVAARAAVLGSTYVTPTVSDAFDRKMEL